MASKTLTASFIVDSSGVKRGVKSAEGDLEGIEGKAKETGDAFDKQTGRIGGMFQRLGSTMGNWGVPFSESVSKMGEKMGDVEGKGETLMGRLADVGKVATIGAAAGLGAAAAESIHLAENYQQSTAALAANAGISVKAANQIGNAFLGTAGKSTFSAQEIMTAYSGVAQQLATVQGHELNASQATEAMHAAMDLAEASGTNLTTTTQALAQVMQAYGVKASGAAKTADVLYSTSTRTGIGVTELAGTINQLKMRLGDATPSLADIGGLMVDLAQHGITGSRGIRLVSTSLSRLITPSSSTAKALAQMGVTLTDAQGKFIGVGPALDAIRAGLAKLPATSNAAAAAQQLVADQAEGLRLAAEKQTPAIKAQVTALKSQEAQLKAQQTALTRSSALYQLFSTSASTLAPIVEGGSAAFEKSAAAVARDGAAKEAAEKQADTFHGSLEKLKATGEDLGVKLGEKLLPKITAVGKALADGVNWLSKHTTAAKILAGVIGGVLSVAIGAFVVNGLAKMVKSGLEAAKTVGTLASKAADAAKAVGDAGETIAVKAMYARDAIGNWGSSAAQTLGRMGSSFASWAVDTARQVARGAAAVATFVAEHAAAAAIYIAQNVAMAASATAAFIAENAATLGIVAGLAALIAGIVYAATHWKQVWGDIKQVATDAWHILDGVWKAIEGGIKATFGEIVGFLHGAWADIEGFFRTWGPVALAVLVPFIGIPLLIWQHFSQIAGYLDTAWSDATAAVSRGVTNVLNVIAGLDSKIVGAFSDAGTWLLGVGKNIVQGLWNGISSLGGWLANQVKSFVKSGIVDAAKSFLGIGSPSRLMADEVGRNVSLGVAMGVGEGGSAATAAVQKLGAQMAAVPFALPAPAAAGRLEGPAPLAAAAGATTYQVNITVEGQVLSAESLATQLGPAMRRELISISQVNGSSGLTL